MSNSCYLCKGLFSEFPKNYDYVEIEGKMQEVHQDCLKNSNLEYKTLSQVQNKEQILHMIQGHESKIKRIYISSYGWLEMK